MNFNDMPGIKQWAVVLGGALLLSVALYFTLFKSQRDANTAAQQRLDDKVKENAELETYRPRWLKSNASLPASSSNSKSSGASCRMIRKSTTLCA